MKPKSIAIIFQQGCSSCRILMRDLKCLEKEYNIVALGAFSSEKSLRLEALKYHADYRSFYADKEVLTKLGVTSQATPQVFIFGEKKVLNFTGRKTCEETYKMAKTNSK